MRKNETFKLIVMLCLAVAVMLTACACNAGTPSDTDPGETQKPTENQTPTDTPTEAPTDAPKPSNVSYEVTVVDAFDEPLAGATVQLCIGDLCQLPVLTNENGVAVVEAKEDTYTVKVSLNGYSGEASYSFPENSNKLKVTLTVVPGTTAETPIFFPEDENEITIPAGKTVYYAVRFGNVTMKINNGKNITVTYNDKEYTPNTNFILELPIGEVDFYAPAVLAFTNTGAEEYTYNVKFIYPVGSMNNPAEIVSGENVATIEADSQGYYFTWIAEGDGELTLTIDEESSNWVYTISNLTAGNYGETMSSLDEGASTSRTITVSEGDEIQIVVGTADYKEGTVKFDIDLGLNG